LSLAGDGLLSLVTERHNAAALSLYKAFGFQEQVWADAYKMSEKSEPYQLVLMTRAKAN